jgi:hypothetical protein
MQAQQHRHERVRAFAGIAGLCVVTALLAGCGGGSSATNASAPQAGAQTTTQHTTTLQSTTHRTTPLKARQTPAQSSPDVGTAHSQTSRTAHRSETSKVTRGHGVQKAQVTPSSKDDSPVVAVRLNPCTLVSVSEAEAITGGPIAGRIEAPLGPTCIYRRAGSKTNITLAVEATSFASVTHGMTKPTKVLVKGRSAYCGKLGAQMLFVPLPDGTVLNVTAPCAVAQRFAATALSRLVA